MSPSIGVTHVPSEGPDNATAFFVGEAPGGEEAARGSPFIGRAGDLLIRYLDRNGANRNSVYLSNLCRYRPPRNKFEALLDTPQLEEGLAELQREIEHVNPNCIIALGSWPLYLLTGMSGKKAGTGILKWRGSRLTSLPRWGSRKVFASMHPSFVLRVWDMNPVFNLDIKHALEDAEYPELRAPKYESHIDPPPDELYDLVHEALDADYISLDIETFPGGRFSCIGFAYRRRDGTDCGVCITLDRPDLTRYVKEIWESDTPKIFQYGTYDTAFMRYFYNWRIGGYYDGMGHDTYVAAASLLPDYPRNLGFLCSIYTRFPYYKEERKLWKEEDDMTSLWEYNIKDIVGTMHVAYAQMGEIGELYE